MATSRRRVISNRLTGSWRQVGHELGGHVPAPVPVPVPVPPRSSQTQARASWLRLGCSTRLGSLGIMFPIGCASSIWTRIFMSIFGVCLSTTRSGGVLLGSAARNRPGAAAAPGGAAARRERTLDAAMPLGATRAPPPLRARLSWEDIVAHTARRDRPSRRATQSIAACAQRCSSRRPPPPSSHPIVMKNRRHHHRAGGIPPGGPPILRPLTHRRSPLTRNVRACIQNLSGS